MKKAILLALIVLVLSVASVEAAGHRHHIHAKLNPVNGSQVTGRVDLKQLSPSGTHIEVEARNLEPGGHYLSIYYGNSTCELVADSLSSDVIGRYTADSKGRGGTEGNVDDDLDEIHSVSVRLDDGSTHPPLLACASF